MRKVNYFGRAFHLIGTEQTTTGFKNFYLKEVPSGFQIVESTFKHSDFDFGTSKIIPTKKNQPFVEVQIQAYSPRGKFLRNGRIFDSHTEAEKFLAKYIHHTK